MTDESSRTADGLLRALALRSSDGAPIRAYAGGLEGAPVVVLINALGMPVDFWLPLSRALAPRFRILTWESRGVADDDADFDAERCDVACHVEDLLALLKAGRVEAAHVIAWCNGAQVALRFASAHASRAGRLVLLNGTFNLPEDVPRTGFEKNMRLLMPKIAGNAAYAQLYQQMANAGAAGPQTGTALCSDPALLQLASAPYQTPARLRRYASLITRTLAEPSHALAERISASVLVVSGAHDQVSHPAASAEIAGRIKGARLVSLDEGDHYSLYHDERLHEVVLDFLSGG